MTSPDLTQQIHAVLNGYDHDAAGQIDHLTGAIRDVLELNFYSGTTQFQRGWNEALEAVHLMIATRLIPPGDPS